MATLEPTQNDTAEFTAAPVVTSDESIESALPCHKQQEAVLAFARRANAQPKLSVLMQDAVALLAKVLGTDCSGIAEYSEKLRTLRLKIASAEKTGEFANPVTEEMPYEATTNMAGYCMQTAGPVSCRELAKEHRFSDITLRKHKIAGAMMVPLYANMKPFGVLGVFTHEPHEFPADDVGFAETIALILSSSISRVQAEETIHEKQDFISTVLDMVHGPVLRLDREGKITNMSPLCIGAII